MVWGERGFVATGFFEHHLLVAGIAVERRKHFWDCERVNELVYTRYRIWVSDCESVQTQVVDTEVYGSTFIRCKHHWGSPFWSGWFNNAKTISPHFILPKFSFACVLRDIVVGMRASRRRLVRSVVPSLWWTIWPGYEVLSHMELNFSRRFIGCGLYVSNCLPTFMEFLQSVSSTLRCFSWVLYVLLRIYSETWMGRECACL